MIRIEGKPNSTSMAKSVGFKMNEGPYSTLTTTFNDEKLLY